MTVVTHITPKPDEGLRIRIGGTLLLQGRRPGNCVTLILLERGAMNYSLAETIELRNALDEMIRIFQERTTP